VRGALISGTPSTISSIWFKTVTTTDDGRFSTLIGEPLDRSYLSIAANSDYETVIETALTGASGTIVPSYEGAAGWKAYQFYPTGKSIILSPRKKLFTILQQKYLIFATEDGWDGANNNMFFFVATDTRATDYTITDLLFTTTDHEETRRLISRDEASVIRSNGSATAIIHNLGFLHSTASLPTNAANGLIGAHTSKVPVHLKYRTGDQITITRPNFTTTRRFKVTEVLDLASTPAWYMILEPLAWFGGTEGGPLPSTIEAAAPYTPLATGNFDGVLSANDNNLQAAIETIDDHGHDATFLDSEGTPADLSGSSNQDGTSTYAARRDHAHQGFKDSEGDPAPIGTVADGTSAYAARRDHVHEGNRLLAHVYYTGGDASTAGASLADADATNLAVTFTAPASGNVLIRLTAQSCPDTAAATQGNQHQWGLRESTTNIAGPHTVSRDLWANGFAQFVAATVAFKRTGLTPGNSYTYKWAHLSSAGGTVRIGASSSNGPAVMEIWGLP
jgi:hypothetical protein